MALCELVEALLVLLKAQYNIYVVMGLLYTGAQKIECQACSNTLSKGDTLYHSISNISDINKMG